MRHCLYKVSIEDSTMENVDFLLSINRVSEVSSPSRQSICRLSNTYNTYNTIHTLNYLRSHQRSRVWSCHLVLQLRVCHRVLRLRVSQLGSHVLNCCLGSTHILEIHRCVLPAIVRLHLQRCCSQICSLRCRASSEAMESVGLRLRQPKICCQLMGYLENKYHYHIPNTIEYHIIEYYRIPYTKYYSINTRIIMIDNTLPTMFLPSTRLTNCRWFPVNHSLSVT